MQRVYRPVKRVLDFVFALLLLVLLAPLMTLLAVMMFFAQGRPVFLFNRGRGC
jgi:lipopolysaccharide/colanic/teichoic acid biosynthesis glycosyltransferase